MTAVDERPLTLLRMEDHLTGRFQAMACPCEVLVDTNDAALAREAAKAAMDEALRIEEKFSRYVPGNVIDRMSSARPVDVDKETADLLDFAAHCHRLSDGLLDVTSGVLRKAWTFDGSDRVPSPEKIQALLPLVGWEKVSWKRPVITLRPGMQIDLGAIGKEYAVDRAKRILQERLSVGFLVNFGGDIAIGGRRRADKPWTIGIEDVSRADRATRVVQMTSGAITTSGDSRKFVMHRGKRYGHILNPRTGWPAEDAPRSVTVAAGTCTEAGIFSTLGMLHGADAEDFLRETGVRFWTSRG